MEYDSLSEKIIKISRHIIPIVYLTVEILF